MGIDITHPVKLSASRIDVRAALKAGTTELARPINKAINNMRAAVSGVRLRPFTTDMNPGALRIAAAMTAHRPPAIAQPSRPPPTAIRLASPTTMVKTSPGENPSVFKMPTSRVRSRIDMESMLAETRRMVKVTAPQMAVRNSFRFPRKETKLRKKACSGSLFVGYGELAKLL